MRSMLIVAVLAAAACTEDAATVRPEPPSEPAFRYELYCDAQGHITTDGPVLALVRRPRTGQQRILSHPTAHPPHGHVNDPAGQRIDANGQAVPPESPQAHLPIQPPAGQKP